MAEFPDIHRYPHFAYDTETTGFDWHSSDHVFGFSLSLPDGRDFYYDIRENPRAWEWWGDNVRRYRGRVICHNASFDYNQTKATHARIPKHTLDDTVIRACLIDEHHYSYDLDTLGEIYLGAKKFDIVPELQAIFGGRGTKNVQMRNLPDAPSDLVGKYARRDSRLTLDLWDWQQGEIERQGIQQIVQFERDLMPIIIGVEERGIRVDINAAERAAYNLTQQIAPLQKELDRLAGFNVNVNSNQGKDNCMERLFKPKYDSQSQTWRAFDGTPLPKTPGGRASLSADALLAMASTESKLVLEIRKLLKLRDTFINGHVLESQYQGRVYPRIHQTKGEDGGTGTGRFSYSSPALQQIPSRDKAVSSVVRPVFLPDEGHSWVDSDKASFEVRVFGHLVNNPRIIQRFREDPHTDFHGFVSELTSLPRNKPPEGGANAKQLNLSMIFNSGNGAIAEQMGLPWKWDQFEAENGRIITYKKAGPQAMRAIRRYHQEIPGVKEFAAEAQRRAERRGYVFTKYGRRLRFPRGYRTYKASGLIIQATSADFNKENWSIIHETLGDEGRLLLNTHDSYGLSLPEGREEELAREVKHAIESRERSRVPLILEINHPGVNWWDSYSKGTWIK